MKIAVTILSDLKGADEAPRGAFKALAVAQESLQWNDEVEIIFNGAGIR
jgi:hypothetical protein